MLILLGVILIGLGAGCILSEAFKKKTEKPDDKKEPPKQ